ncbi:MAG: guanylate kinase [Deltaproteobacteria bacterium]|jgi:guanylate kinase|nr:guanylate kinase [Deltaproteobacteria bacterium]
MSAAGRIFVVSGPSGSGKSTLIRELRQKVPGLGYSISHTSRPPRGQEKNGVEYHFVSKESFQKMVENGEFVEWAEVYQDLYGTSVSSLRSQITMGLDVIMDIDVQGARNIKDHFKDAILIYVLPPSLEILEKRLRERGTDDEKAIRTRLKKAGKEIKNCVSYDYLLFNDQLDQTVEELKSILIAERCRKSVRLSKAQTLFNLGPH